MAKNNFSKTFYSQKRNMGVIETIGHGINNLTELLRKYFLLFKTIAEHTAAPTFIQLTELFCLDLVK